MTISRCNMNGSRTCPRCNTRMKVLHVYPVNNTTTIRDLRCCSCGSVVVAQDTIVQVDPPRGKGAKAIVRQIEKNRLKD